MSKGKILLVCKNYFDDSSVSKYNQHLSSFLISKGFSVNVISFDDFVSELGFKEFKIVSDIQKTDEVVFRDWLMLLNTKLKLMGEDLHRKEGFNLIHCSDWQVYPSCLLLKDSLNVPLVLSFFNAHSLNDSEYSRVVKEFELIGINNADTVLVSDEDLSLKVNNDNVKIIDPILIDWQHRVLKEYERVMNRN